MFINATQSTTVRLDTNKTPAQFTGLCTEQLATCLCLVVISPDKTRISLTHTATAADAHDIVRECRWAGEGSTLYVIKGSHYNTPSMVQFLYSKTTLFRRLKALIVEEQVAITWDDTSFDQPTWAVSVTRAGDIELRTASPSAVSIPEYNYRYLIHMINTHVVIQERLACVPMGIYFHPLDLLFDGTSWAETVTLSEQGQTLLTHLEKDKSVLSQIDQDMKGYIASYREVIKRYESRIKTANIEGVDFYKSGNYKAAIEQFEQSVRNLKLLFGNRTLKLGSVYYNLGSAHNKMRCISMKTLNIVCVNLSRYARSISIHNTNNLEKQKRDSMR